MKRWTVVVLALAAGGLAEGLWIASARGQVQGPEGPPPPPVAANSVHEESKCTLILREFKGLQLSRVSVKPDRSMILMYLVRDTSTGKELALTFMVKGCDGPYGLVDVQEVVTLAERLRKGSL
jgi:hypothetical protein